MHRYNTLIYVDYLTNDSLFRNIYSKNKKKLDAFPSTIKLTLAGQLALIKYSFESCVQIG